MNRDGLFEDLFFKTGNRCFTSNFSKKSSEQSRFTLGKENSEYASKQTHLCNAEIRYSNW